MEDLTASLRETRDALKSQLPDLEALDRHLQLPLRRLGLCQEPQSSSATWFDSSEPAEADMIIRRHLPNLQAALVERVVPTWLLSLKEDPMALAHLEAYFYPALPTAPSPAQLHNARRVALSAYLVLAPLLGSPACPPQSREFVVAALERLALTYPIDSIYWAIWGTQSGGADQGRAELQWEEAIKVLVGLPTKVANAIGSRNQELHVAEEIPSGLISRLVFFLYRGG
jgi:telomere length regulation protein